MTLTEILMAVDALEPELVELVKKGVDAICARRTATTRDEQVAADRAIGDAVADAAEIEATRTK